MDLPPGFQLLISYRGISYWGGGYINKLTNKHKSKCIIFLVGGGKSRDMKLITQKIRSLKLTNRIKILNYINEDSYKIINNFDLLISATKDFEAFGYSIVEALFVKTPVICTNVGGVKEFVNKKNALIIQPNNIQSIKKSLIYFFNNKKWIKMIEYDIKWYKLLKII